jgi:NDP-sugar pyrophosphorylase family protein
MEGLTMNIDKLTVLILAAGYGRRMGPFSRMVNKGLIPYKDKPLISHIIDKFPKNTKFVIACGHMGQQLKDYVNGVHDDKNIVFVDIPDYSEGNTGPATTVQHCAEHIKDGFMLVACDTLFEFNWQDRMDHSWIGVYPVDSTIAKDYDWIERDGDDIIALHNKEASETAVDAFIGLMYDKDGSFLRNLQRLNARENIQGFNGIKLKAHTVKKWLDFGTYEKWQKLTEGFPENSFFKPNELFYHDNGKVIKYFVDEKQAVGRYKRAVLNPGCMPRNLKSINNFFIHDWADGDIIYNQLNPAMFQKMLAWCEEKLWIAPTTKFDPEITKTFYYTKTKDRIDQFRAKYMGWSENCIVNRQAVDTIDSYLNLIDWEWLCNTVEWRFIHGDLHFDNTIYDTSTDLFTAIDWRTDFAGDMNGDLYYDLAKMLGGIWLNYRAVKNGELSYHEKSDYATIEIPSVPDAEIYEKILWEWVIKQNLDWKKVKILVPLIYLNMSPLHEPPFDKFLFALSQLNFKKEIR